MPVTAQDKNIPEQARKHHCHRQPVHEQQSTAVSQKVRRFFRQLGLVQIRDQRPVPEPHHTLRQLLQIVNLLVFILLNLHFDFLDQVNIGMAFIIHQR
ncbi:hypothetical protein D3C73_1047870 [compost metagenome]